MLVLHHDLMIKVLKIIHAIQVKSNFWQQSFLKLTDFEIQI